MGLEISTSQAFRTTDELAALVQAIVGADPITAQETHWLEWKGSLPLTRPEGQFAIAKAILGFANREPTRAAAVCEGTAYVVVGVKPGAALGVEVVDHADLAQGLRKYVHGPRWIANYVRYEGVTVLVITVEAPDAGHRIHVLEKDFDRAYAGTVFHRGVAQSEPAGPKEMAMLQDRLLAGQHEPELSVDLALLQSAPLLRLDVDPASIQAWLKRREAYARAKEERPDPPLPSQQLGRLPGIVRQFENLNYGRYSTPEDKEAFNERVAEHLGLCEERLVNYAVRRVTESKHNKIAFAVTNSTPAPIVGVQLTVKLLSPGLLAYAGIASAKRMPSLPRWPDPAARLLGEIRTPFADELAGLAPIHPLDAGVVEREDFVELTYNIGDLRPGDVVETQPVTVVVWSPEVPDEVPVELSAGAMNRQGNAKAGATLMVSASGWRLANLVNPEPA